MEWQTTFNQQRGSSSQKSYGRNQGKKNFVNYPKQQNVYKPSKNPPNRVPQYDYQPKSTTVTSKPLRKPLINYNSHNTHVLIKSRNSTANEQVIDVNKYLENLNNFIPKLNAFKRVNQNGIIASYSVNEKTMQISELTGFKIVQNGITIHDETFDEKGAISDKDNHQNLAVFSFEDKLKPHTESTLMFRPYSKEISLPTFIEAQE